ncbi:PID-CTERM protein-sorting domain-containing protein [Autumnicola musiva]|uniref:Gram-positive cocci surface proteins LPxTG domain-containing protein n=1 Tax=Autumnicola musiva TaxID=3075589 RepID=A0ABU3D5S7_9FLAO|nr:hypothetical protein [Zunongwangia sp. F117]MDT0676353.1 hypothetical protein [Zunongwangia sp. F117]
MTEREKRFKKLKTVAMVMLLLFLTSNAFSSVQEPPSPGGVPPPPGLPIDFGISGLIASGIALGVYHLRKKRED